MLGGVGAGAGCGGALVGCGAGAGAGAGGTSLSVTVLANGLIAVFPANVIRNAAVRPSSPFGSEPRSTAWQRPAVPASDPVNVRRVRLESFTVARTRPAQALAVAARAGTANATSSRVFSAVPATAASSRATDGTTVAGDATAAGPAVRADTTRTVTPSARTPRRYQDGVRSPPLYTHTTGKWYSGPMDVPHPLPEQLADLIAQRFRLLGEPMRIRLLDMLRGGEATVGELTDRLGASQQNVSKHLGLLHQAGIVERSKHGTFVRYAIADEGVFALCEQVCGGMRRQIQDLDLILTGGTPA